jgi:hypothetical protein
MAFERGFWLRDHVPSLLGAWLISAGWFSLTGGVVAGVVASRRNAETLKVR